MPFDLATWKGKFTLNLKGWQPRMRESGVGSIYAFLSAAALWPVVEAARTGDWSALAALGGVLAGVGTNLLANQVQGWNDEADAARHLAETLPQQPELRTELDVILEQLDALQAAVKALPEAERPDCTRRMHEELAQLGSRLTNEIITVRDGAVARGKGARAAGKQGMLVEGNIGGDVIGPGGKKIIHQAPDPRKIKAQEREAARQRYLSRLYGSCCYLPLAAMGGEESTGAEVTLDKVYISLDTQTLVELSEAEKKSRKKEQSFARQQEETRPLSALEAARQSPQMVLLGEPGGGKSTFVRNLLAWQAEVLLGKQEAIPGFSPDLLPVFMQLRDLTPRLAGQDLAALPEDKHRQVLVKIFREQVRENLEALEVADFKEGLLDSLRAGGCLLVLDGLDEVPAGLREGIRRVVAALLAEYRLQRVIITCRVRSYVGSAVLANFQPYRLAPFDDEKVRQFTQAWYLAQKALRRVTAREAEKKAQDLAEVALGENLRELSSNPMMLTTMAIIHQKEIGLPEERVKLYSLAIDVLLRRWQKYKAGEKGMAPSVLLNDFLRSDLRLRKVIERLAYEAHSSRNGEKEAVDLPRGLALTLLESAEYLGSVELASEFLDYVDQRAGLLVGRGGEAEKPPAYTFPHRTFQEYLAGCYIVGLRDVLREMYQRAAQGDDWSLAIQLGAEELYFNRLNQNLLLDLAYHLSCEPSDTQRQRAVLWSGNLTLLLGAETVERDTGTPEGGAAFLEQLKPRLAALLSRQLSPPERAEAGRDLARLGDPRPEVNSIDAMQFCYIPAGPFRMGSDPEADPEADDDESPPHEVDLPGYWMARYPLTNAQYAAFVRAGGYAEPRYWVEAEAQGYWKTGAFKGRYDSEARQAPVDFGTPFNLPNHPVVGVSWYEALACCRWLEETWGAQGFLEEGWRVSLPSEAQWEKAARGGVSLPGKNPLTSPGQQFPRAQEAGWIENPMPARKYPWGQQIVAEQANYADAGIGTTSALGCFPGSASPYGVEELSGNVWEWTRSLWKGYPYPAQGSERSRREALDASQDAPRVLRGGAFDSESWSVRCAFRDWRDPYRRGRDVGFRVVVSPSSPQG